ncbi:hypothetical protein LDENG_00256530 [Lucifuga dentata]|nr:hypothetical protein LDENG_00256530 [Lucifuga dentata]
MLRELKDHTTHFACSILIYLIFIHVTLLTIISQSIYWNSELKMFFLPSRPPLVSVHSAIKINLLILETFLG